MDLIYKSSLFLLKLLAIIFLSAQMGCVDLPDEDLIDNISETDDINQLNISEDFDFATTKTVKISLYTYDNEDQPLTYIPITIHSFLSDSAETIIAKGATTEKGIFETTIEVPTAFDSIYFYTDYLGLPDWHRVATDENEITYVMGGSTPSTGIVDRQKLEEAEVNMSSEIQFRKKADPTSKYSYMGLYDNSGVPAYLVPERDHISQDLLDLVNVSLPERRPVPSFNPEYISDDVNGDVLLKEDADVWITFVHEGAGYRNALGYYQYDLNAPPQSIDDIDSLYIVFPNASLRYSGGGLRAGDKVHLGRFPAQTGIGFFLVPNGWKNGKVNAGIRGHIKYSNRNLNTFTNEINRSHVALLKDDKRELLLMGMEDISRPGGDKDFNDAIFYITLSSFDALEVENLAATKLDHRPDDDNDGIANVNDEFPDDPLRAFSIDLPGENKEGTFFFEDFWPRKGDYDFNDMVVGYHYEINTNSANHVVEMFASFSLKAIGAGFSNGFGFQLNIDPSFILNATGFRMTNNIITLNSNGTEANQGKATFIVFDNAFGIMRNPNGGFVNTNPDEPYVEPVNIDIAITFTEPIPKNNLGSAPFNPFIFVDGDRSIEVHMADNPPTDLADPTLFGTEDDNTSLNSGNYYKSKNNLPWGLHFGTSVGYPSERSSLLNVYNKFGQWAQSSGTENKSWYYDVSDVTKKYIK